MQTLCSPDECSHTNCYHIARHSLTVLSGWLCVSFSICLFPFTLQLKPTGSVCRPRMRDCDLAEYCTGLSAYCPTDAYTLNGLPCNRGKGYCFNGQCPSRQQHCKRLWGPGKRPSIYAYVLICFQCIIFIQ